MDFQLSLSLGEWDESEDDLGQILRHVRQHALPCVLRVRRVAVREEGERVGARRADEYAVEPGVHARMLAVAEVADIVVSRVARQFAKEDIICYRPPLLNIQVFQNGLMDHEIPLL